MPRILWRTWGHIVLGLELVELQENVIRNYSGCLSLLWLHMEQLRQNLFQDYIILYPRCMLLNIVTATMRSGTKLTKQTELRAIHTLQSVDGLADESTKEFHWFRTVTLNLLLKGSNGSNFRPQNQGVSKIQRWHATCSTSSSPQARGSNGSCITFDSFRVFLRQLSDISGIAPMHQGVCQEGHQPWKANANLAHGAVPLPSFNGSFS